MTLILQPTSLSQWQALLNEAELAAAITLQVDLESYLAFMLMRFCTQADIAKNPVGLDFLLSFNSLSHLQDQKLQEVGDKCLLFSGLFPAHAHKKRVSIQYYIDLGQTAYSLLSTHHHAEHKQGTFELYASLCNHFVLMRDVLDAMRDSDTNRPQDLLTYFDLWVKFKSHYAFKKLSKNPVFTLQPRP